MLDYFSLNNPYYCAYLIIGIIIIIVLIKYSPNIIGWFGELWTKQELKKLPKDKLGRLHHQLVLFGRYNCKAKNPSCNICKLKDMCKYYKKNN